MLKLYGPANRTATNVLKIRAALYHAQAQFEYVVIDLTKGEQRNPDFLALNPHGKVPVLVDGDFALPESDAILWYVGEKYADLGLVPRDAQGRARVLEWCDFASAGLYAWSFQHFIHTSYAEPAHRSAWAAEAALAAISRALRVLEDRVSAQEFVAVGALSIADFAINAVLHQLRTRAQYEPGSLPQIDAYGSRIASVPAWGKALAAEP